MSRKARRRKKLGITLAGGETAPQRATGRDRRHTNQPDGPPPIMQARAGQITREKVSRFTVWGPK